MATTYPSTGSDARERSRLAFGQRRGSVASGGPVGAAIQAGRGEGAGLDERTRRLSIALSRRIAADIELLAALGGFSGDEPGVLPAKASEQGRACA